MQGSIAKENKWGKKWMEISAKFQEIAEEELGIARQERQERLGESNVMLCDKSHAQLQEGILDMSKTL